MSDRWLDAGHGDGQSLAPVSSTAAPASTAAAAALGWRSRVVSPVAVAVVASIVLIASGGAAYAIRETIIPSLGAPTPRSVWQNPAPADEPVAALIVVAPTSTTVTTTETPTTTTAPAIPPSSTPTVPAASTASTSPSLPSSAVPVDQRGRPLRLGQLGLRVGQLRSRLRRLGELWLR